jgi:class 3 adenylate cyclase
MKAVSKWLGHSSGDAVPKLQRKRAGWQQVLRTVRGDAPNAMFDLRTRQSSANKFCSECGAILSSGASQTAIPIPKSTAPSAERRQLTVMFCDMVGSSALSTRLDPEEQRDVVSTFQGCCAKEIKRLGGMVAQYLRDGVLVYFGYPAAHEDDAERAIRAGPAIIDSIGKPHSIVPVTLQARIGIASGVVVVGDLIRESVTQENAAIGETTNLAARQQSLVERNTIVIGPETYRLVGGLFEYYDLGPQALKGFGEPVHVRQVIRPSKIDTIRHTLSTTCIAARAMRPVGVREERGADCGDHWSRVLLHAGRRCRRAS